MLSESRIVFDTNLEPLELLQFLNEVLEDQLKAKCDDSISLSCFVTEVKEI
jgi:hypothetical protein